VNLIQDALKIPVVLMGFGLPDDRIHGPNEKIHLPNFFKGIETSIRFLTDMGRALGCKPRARIQPLGLG
jgi:acetylornithine deacetylase/succinyl-diaminopimelate desuccinylase-like protein